MEVTIKKLSQDLNLGSGETENFAIIELPNGGVVRALINEEAAQAITDCFVNGQGAVHKVNQEVSYHQRVMAGTESFPEPALSALPTPAGFRETNIDGVTALEYGASDEPTPQPQRAKSKMVGVDEMGYPIMRGPSGSSDPGEISHGGDGADEDGVGQV